jgi:hypothetical protein
MSGSYPTTPEFQSIGFASEQKTITSTTDSGKMFAVQIDGQRWKFTARYSPMDVSEFNPVYAFIMKQRSQKETFTIVLPKISYAKGSETGTILVNGVHNAGDTTINIDGHTADTAQSFKAGDKIKFGGHSKVYMIVEDVTPSGNASTITIEPPLRSALADNEVVTYDAVPFTVRLTNDIQEMNLGVNNLYGFEVDFIEAL